MAPEVYKTLLKKIWPQNFGPKRTQKNFDVLKKIEKYFSSECRNRQAPQVQQVPLELHRPQGPRFLRVQASFTTAYFLLMPCAPFCAYRGLDNSSALFKPQYIILGGVWGTNRMGLNNMNGHIFQDAISLPVNSLQYH